MSCCSHHLIPYITCYVLLVLWCCGVVAHHPYIPYHVLRVTGVLVWCCVLVLLCSTSPHHYIPYIPYHVLRVIGLLVCCAVVVLLVYPLVPSHTTCWCWSSCSCGWAHHWDPWLPPPPCTHVVCMCHTSPQMAAWGWDVCTWCAWVVLGCNPPDGVSGSGPQMGCFGPPTPKSGPRVLDIGTPISGPHPGYYVHM